LKVQSRSSKIVTRVQKGAVWTLVCANLLYALLAIGLTTFALLSSSITVHQVCTRMTVAGLVAQLFEGQFAWRMVSGSNELFEENSNHGSKPKRVMTVRLPDGGTELGLLDTGSERTKSFVSTNQNRV